MKLLQVSISEDGYTQPVVGWLNNGIYEVVDGFHRTRVAKEVEEISARILGRVPIVAINDAQNDRGDRIAATIRHNRARGKHAVSKMSDIVLELKRRNWSDTKIARDLGMDEDEVLRLTQITGLAEAFRDHNFSAAWEADLSDEQFVEAIDDGVAGGQDA
jgi:ParB-like chromosome segregation protein Spo0J